MLGCCWGEKLFDKVQGIVYSCDCVYRGLSGASRSLKIAFHLIINSRTSGIIPTSPLSHRLAIGSELLCDEQFT
jgi:hypothetical protein